MSGISIFMYHQVGKFPAIRTHRATYCDVSRFRSQMRVLKWCGIRVMSLSEAMRALRGDIPMPNRAVVLTFDDGYRNFREHALPILEEFGYPATVYVIAGMIGGYADWLTEDGHAAPPLMDWDELQEIRRAGVEIGSHGLHHIRFAELEPAIQKQEMVESKAILEDGLGEAVAHMCYPYGSHNLDTIHAAAEAGFVTGVTCQRAAATSAFDALALPRKAVSYGDDMLGFLWKLYMKDAPKGQAILRSN